MIALDLFAGHGWGVACQKLGIEEYGVEIMPEAVETRTRNGMSTIYRDVWEGLERDVPMMLHEQFDLLIASPPCQTFSMAGGGAGRKALDEVVGLIDAKAYRDVAALRAFGEKHDPRTSLVLTPLAHVYRDTPAYVVFEQVPPVLPVWERCAEEMRRWGYSVWTGNLQAEMYGVPQTRKRAVLIARADGIEAAPPVPTHSRYYPRDPKRLDPGVLPWVSMAEALGWGEGDALRSNQTVAGIGRAMRDSSDPALTMTQTTRSMQHIVAVERHRGAGLLERGGERPARPVAEPAPTVTGNASGTTPGGFRKVMRSNYSGGGPAGATAAERGRTMREDDKPSLAMTGKPGHWVRPSFTVTGGGTGSTGGAEPFGSRARASMPEGASRITVDEAAALQSYPPGFEFAGTKTKQFLQVGNAVPPLLAEAILRTFL